MVVILKDIDVRTFTQPLPKKGKKLLLELASYQIRLFGKKEVASKKKKFVIPQEPGTQMSIFDFM